MAQTQAMALAQEGIEAVRSIKDGAWNELQYNQSKIELTSNQWILSGDGTTEQIGDYLRVISFSDACRDVSNNIVNCPGTYTDIYSKKVLVVVSWPIRGGVNASVQQIAYLTNWSSRYWKEDVVADFSDGSFQSTAVSPILGDGDGAVILQMQ